MPAPSSPVEPVASIEFSSADRADIDRAIRSAEELDRFEFSVYVGDTEGDVRTAARRLHAALVAPARSVLVLVDPSRRAVEIVTGDHARTKLTDDECERAVALMAPDLADGKVAAGLVKGIEKLGLLGRD
jgi:uncharacterized membrane protein YgcG